MSKKLHKGQPVKVIGGRHRGKYGWFDSYSRKHADSSYCLVYFRKPNVQGAIVAVDDLKVESGPSS